MSREELSELRRFDQGLHLSHCCAEAATEPTLQGDNLHHGCTTTCRICLRCVWDSIERLLAQEREKMQEEIQAYQSDPNYDNRYLQGQDDMRELMIQQREKVREMCAKQAESWNDTTDWMKARQRLPFRIAASIRQLDLAKKLAASSTEEKEKNDG